jgi:hypothetical protein
MAAGWRGQRLHEGSKIRGELAFYGDGLSRAWMDELKICCVKRDSGNPTLRGFVMAVLAVADYGVAERGELHSDLILQSRQQSNPYQRRRAERAFEGIAEFSARCFAIPLRTELLIHSFSSKMVN